MRVQNPTHSHKVDTAVGPKIEYRREPQETPKVAEDLARLIFNEILLE